MTPKKIIVIPKYPQPSIDRLGQSSISDSFLVNDDFESYAPNSFPSTGGWMVLYSGYGLGFLGITQETSFSGHKSMQMKGAWNWCADVYHDLRLPDTVCILNFEFCVKTPQERSDLIHDDCGLNCQYVGIGYNNYTGYINGHMELGKPNTWYRLTVRINGLKNTADFWINGILREQNTHWDGKFQGFSRVTMHAGWGPSTYFFDDIKVW